MAQTIHPEDALFNAGASDGYYEITGASYAPADQATSAPAMSTIDLSTVDQTGCLLTHSYATGETTLKWDTEPLDPVMHGTADDVQAAVEDIAGGQLDHQALFEAFRVQMTGAAGGQSNDELHPRQSAFGSQTMPTASVLISLSSPSSVDNFINAYSL